MFFSRCSLILLSATILLTISHLTASTWILASNVGPHYYLSSNAIYFVCETQSSYSNLNEILIINLKLNKSAKLLGYLPKEPDNQDPVAFKLSPDEKTILYRAYSNPTNLTLELFSTSLENYKTIKLNTTLVKKGRVFGDFQFDTMGSNLFYCANTRSTMQRTLYKVPYQGGKSTLLFEPSAGWNIEQIFDQNFVITSYQIIIPLECKNCHDTDKKLISISFDGKQIKELDHGSLYSDYRTTLYSKNDYLLYEANIGLYQDEQTASRHVSQLFYWPIKENETLPVSYQSLKTNISLGDFAWQISPNKNFVVWVETDLNTKKNKMFYAYPDKQEIKQLDLPTILYDTPDLDFIISSNNKDIILTAPLSELNNSEIFLIPLNGNKSERIHPLQTNQSFETFEMSPDGNAMAYCLNSANPTSQQIYQIYYRNLYQKESRLLWKTSNLIKKLFFSPDRKSLFYVAQKNYDPEKNENYDEGNYLYKISLQDHKNQKIETAPLVLKTTEGSCSCHTEYIQPVLFLPEKNKIIYQGFNENRQKTFYLMEI
ncbi:MAG: hypothetical protein R3F23_06605 [Verrucomicrobiia bacterium]